MVLKKNDKVNLEKKKSFFFLLGLIAVIIITIIIFEHGTKKKNNYFALYPAEVDLEVKELFYKTKRTEPVIHKTSVLKEIKMIADKNEDEDTVSFTIDAEITEFQAFDFDPIEYPDDEEDDDFNKIWYFTEKKPEFPGGETALKKYIANSIKYPLKAVNNDIQGRVYVKFIVNKEGKIEQAKVMRSIDPLLDEEALRIINQMPDWKPGTNNGIKVSVWFSLPVSFVINY